MRKKGAENRDPMGELRGDLEGLQRDAATLSEELERLATRAREAEALAISALSAGDEAAARSRVEECQSHVDAAGVVDAELIVVNAMIATCREALATFDQQVTAAHAPPPNDRSGDGG